MNQLTDKGWKLYYSCMCGGAPKEYYNHPSYPGYEVRVRPRRNTFTILSQNMVIAGPNYLYDLDKKLLEYGLS